MVTTGSKFFFGLSVAALGAAAAYGWSTDGGFLGVLTLGLRGGVGDLSGYTVLLSLAGMASCLGIAASAFRDADPEAAAAVARLEAAPPVAPPAGVSYWPVVGAFGGAVTAIGLVVGPELVVGGLFVVGIAFVEWMVQAWADRATGDPAVNQQVRNRLMYPFEVPLAGAIAIAAVVFSLSRVLLAVDKTPASIVAIVVAASILGIAFLVAYRPKLSSNVLAGLLVLAAVGVVVAGIVAAAAGEREFESHDEQHSELAPGAEGGEG